jgi:hypothetical protein
VTTQSGVKSMSISLDGARERLVTQSHAVIDCMTAVWTYKYSNGYTVTLRGPLTCHVVLTSTTNSTSCLKFDMLSFEANYHDKYIALDAILDHEVSSPKTPRARSVTLSVGSATPAPPNASQQQQQQHQQQHLQQQQQLQLQREEDRKWEEPRRTFEHASIPGEPVNAFGIPQATMRCLEVRFALLVISRAQVLMMCPVGGERRSNGRSDRVFERDEAWPARSVFLFKTAMFISTSLFLS